MKNLQPTTDKFAIGLSMLCIVHCLVLPIAIGILPFAFASTMESEVFHRILLVAILPSSALSLALGCRKHKSWLVLAWGGVGLLLLVMAGTFGAQILGEIGEKAVTFVASICIIYAHVQNYSLCRRCNCH